MPFTVHNIHTAILNILILHFKNPIKKRETYCSLQNTEGKWKGWIWIWSVQHRVIFSTQENSILKQNS